MIYNKDPMERINNGKKAFVYLACINNFGFEFMRNRAGDIVMKEYILTMDEEYRTHRKCISMNIIDEGKFLEAYDEAKAIILARDEELMRSFDEAIEGTPTRQY